MIGGFGIIMAVGEFLPCTNECPSELDPEPQL
jgi:hypothetical protein